MFGLLCDLFLWSGVIVVVFYDFGILLEWIDKLKMWVSGVVRILELILSMCEWMFLRLEDLLIYSDDNFLWIKLIGVFLNIKFRVICGVKIRWL